MPHDVISYNVIYYKRTNKVHKSKGVEKMDGILTVCVPQVQLKRVDGVEESLSSSDDEESEQASRRKLQKVAIGTSAIVYSKVQTDLAQRVLEQSLDRASNEILLGGYLVEIIHPCESTGIRQSPCTISGTRAVECTKPNECITTNPSVPLRRNMCTSLTRAAHVPSHSTKRPAYSVRKPFKPLQNITRSAISGAQTKSDSCAAGEADLPPINAASRILVPKPFLSRKQLPNHLPTHSQTLPHLSIPNSIRRALQPHQVSGVEFLFEALTASNRRGAILADEMGLGKTLMTITIITAMFRQRSRSSKFYIVCPSSLVTNWANEFDKWIGKASQPKRVVVNKGGTEGLTQLRCLQPGQVLIISYDLLRRFATHLCTSVTLLVVDEGHRLKNKHGSLTLTALESVETQARLCLTATPIQNNLTELFTLSNFVCPGVFGTMADFGKNFERPIAAANARAATPDELFRAKRQVAALEQITKTFILRRLQKEILLDMLPTRYEFLLFCQPSIQQSEMYQRISLHPSDPLATLTKLRKVCSHPALIQPFDSPNPVTLSGKFQVLETLLLSIRELCPNEKIVIVSNFTSTLSLVESLIFYRHRLSFVRLDGTVEPSQRQQLVETFSRVSTIFGCLLSSKAGGCGLNLVAANRLVLLDPDWNPASDIQAMGRIYRQGQTRPCYIYRLFTAGTVEEVMYQRQTHKSGLAALTVDCEATSSSHLHFKAEELADCFTLKMNCASDTAQKCGWPNYTGSTILPAEDEPLVHTAERLTDTLRYIYNTQMITGQVAVTANTSTSDMNDSLLGQGKATRDRIVQVESSLVHEGRQDDDASTSEEEFDGGNDE